MLVKFRRRRGWEGTYLCQVEGTIDTRPMKKKNYQRYFLKNREPPMDSNRTEIENTVSSVGDAQWKSTGVTYKILSDSR